MQSVFGWIDFSEVDRRRILRLLNAFREPDTRDELGIGSVRDALANLLFPGTSTIQTRAKYMLFVPWMYLKHERHQTPSANIPRRARHDEIKLIFSLLKSDDTNGIIGSRARKKLQRLPSNIYWSALTKWGILRFNASQDQYHRYLDAFYHRRGQERRMRDDTEPVTGWVSENWDPGLPPPPSEFPGQTRFALTKEEAEYLHDQIMMNCTDSLLAFLVDRTTPVKIPFVWQHPQMANFPLRLRRQVQHAHTLSEVMHGAALLYNLMLGEKSESDQIVALYTERLAEWAKTLKTQWTQLTNWSLREFWSTATEEQANIPLQTQLFVERWIRLVLHGRNVRDLPKEPAARALISDRELVLKRNRARLHNQRALELWSGAAGAGQLDYRWHVVNGIVNDILEGL